MRRWLESGQAVRAHPLVTLLVLLGLLGMHGLAGGLPTTSPTAAMSSMRFEHAVTNPGVALIRTAAPTSGVSTSASPLGTVSGLVMSCGMDHGNCVAVLRKSAPLSPLSVVLPAVHASGAPAASSAVCLRAGPPMPPDVSLIGLCISRT
ncbi:MAG: DUF6153 family protein [Jatrophihabitans sp.]